MSVSRRDFLKAITALTAGVILPRLQGKEFKDLFNDRERLSPVQRVEAQTPYDRELTRSIMGLPENMREGGPVYPNALEIYNLLGARQVFTVNLVDGTSALFTRDENNNFIQTGEYYSIIGRELTADPALTGIYRNSPFSVDGSSYNGQYGVHISATGIHRTTYTPQGMYRYLGSGYVENFGLIGGRTDIAYLTLLFEENFLIMTAEQNSNYTIHRVPEGTLTDQSIALREPDLRTANREGRPVPYPTLHRSSGCVNYDANTWFEIKRALEYRDGTTIVVFTYPGVDQEILLRQNHRYSEDPFAYLNITGNNPAWPYQNYVDRRGYFNPLDPRFLETIEQNYFGPDRDELIARMIANQAGEQ